MIASIGHTAAVLDELGVGGRLWFWFCPDLDLEAPRLMLSKLDEDPAMDALSSAIRSVDLPVGARTYRGLACVSSLGRIRFGARRLSDGALRSLAGWATWNYLDHAGLARLYGASFLSVGAGGELLAEFSEVSIWLGIPDRELPGTPRAYGRRVREMVPGENAWYWMTDSSTEHRPALALTELEVDPDALELSRRSGVLRGMGEEVYGVLRRLVTEQLVMTTVDDVRTVVEVASKVVSAYGQALEPMFDAQVVRIREPGLGSAEGLSVSMNLSRQVEVLRRLSRDRIGWFWYMRSKQSGRSDLVMSEDRQILREEVRSRRSEGPSIMGKLVVGQDGRVQFRTRRVVPGFIVGLAMWAAEHSESWPELRRLRNAILVVEDVDGSVVDELRDDSAWALLD